MNIVFGLFVQQFAVTVQIEKYVWHLKNVCVLLDGEEHTAQKVRRCLLHLGQIAVVDIRKLALSIYTD